MNFRRVAAIGFVISLCTVGFPEARAESPWCSVSPSQAAAGLPSILHSLDAARSRPPAPLPRLHTEGTLPHQGIYDESVAAKRDLPLMRDAALAWRAGAGNEWLDFARRYLMAWVAT